MTIGLHLIAKDEKKQIQRILKKYEKYFDEIVIAYDDNKARFKTSNKVKWHKYEWIDDFSHKRNFVDSLLTTDYILRMDTDDELINPERIPFLLDKAEKENISIIYCFYIYSKDEWGSCNAGHYRDIIYKNTDNLYWNKKIHENILPKSTANYNIHIDEVIKLDHLIDYEHSIKSSERNIRYLLKEYNETKDNPDLRTIAYLGRMLFSVKQFDKALFFLEKHVMGSGWDEDRYVTWCQIAEIFLQKEDYEKAIAAAFEALQEKPDYPDGYLKLHDIYFAKKKWLKAIEWGKLGLSKPVPTTFTVLDLSSYTWRPALSMAFTYYQLGEYINAMKFFKIAQKRVPDFKFIKENEHLFVDAIESRNYVERLLWLIKFYEAKDKTKVQPLVETIPEKYYDDEAIVKIRNSFLPAKAWEDKSIVIFCGFTPEAWSPESVKTGIGGSEEAVINLSDEFTKLGYKVTVYNNCGEEGDYKGVEYKHFCKFSRKDEFNILISWRMNIFPYKVKARKKIVWLHDLPYNLGLNSENTKDFDKIVVLSEYHKSLLPKEVPSEKVFVSTNGIVPDDFKNLGQIRRISKRLIYASSYNRGLETILEKWKEIRKEVPEAEIHIFYGWGVYDDFVASGHVIDKGFKERMLRYFEMDGVYEHGRIGHKELLKEYYKSEIFAYPSHYDGEINCIALTKAIACDCKIITNRFAVLGERSPNLVDDDKFIKVLIKMLNEPYVPKDTSVYIACNSWGAVAKDWKENLLNEKL